MASESAFSVQ